MVHSINSLLKLPLKILHFTGMLQTSRSTKGHKIYGIICHFIFIELFMILQLGYFIESKKMNDFASLMTLFPTFIALIVKNTNFMMKIDRFERLVVDIHKLATEEFNGSKKLEKHKKRAGKLLKTYVSIGLTTSTLAMANPILHHHWAFPMWLPFNLSNSTIPFWIISIYQSIDSYAYGTVNEIFDMIPIFLMSFVVGMLEELSERLEKIKKRKTLNPDGSINVAPMQDNTEELLKCIEIHKRIQEVNKEIEEIFSNVILFQGIMSSMVLCTTVYTMTIVSIKKSFALFCELLVYMMVMTLQILMPCYYYKFSRDFSTQIGVLKM